MFAAGLGGHLVAAPAMDLPVGERDGEAEGVEADADLVGDGPHSVEVAGLKLPHASAPR